MKTARILEGTSGAATPAGGDQAKPSQPDPCENTRFRHDGVRGPNMAAVEEVRAFAGGSTARIQR